MKMAWMVRYDYGGLRMEAYEVVSASDRRVVLKDGGAASGYRSRVPTKEVLWTEQDAIAMADALVSKAIEDTKEELANHETQLRKVRDRAAALRREATP